MQYIPEPSDIEDAVTWLGFSFALPLLLAALLILAFIRGLETNSNSIHKNLVLCVLLAETAYFTALKARRSLVMHEVRKLPGNTEFLFDLVVLMWMTNILSNIL